jgi:hypothetical protein
MVKEYSWVNEPPIREVKGQELQAIKKLFLEHVVGWSTTNGLTVERNIFYTRWEEHYINAGTIANQMCSPAYVYHIDGQPLGLVTVLTSDSGDSIYIPEIATHPGTEGVGGALVERVVKLSVESGFGGVVTLFACSDKASDAFLKLGFVFDGSPPRDGVGDMTLNPAKNDKWTQVGKEWKLAGCASKKYLAAKEKS